MSETDAQSQSQNQARPIMQKRVERKADGRALIYYTFEKKPKEQSSNTSSGAIKQ